MGRRTNGGMQTFAAGAIPPVFASFLSLKNAEGRRFQDVQKPAGLPFFAET